MYLQLSKQSVDSLLIGGTVVDDLLFVGKKHQPAALIEKGELYMFLPKFFEDFEADEHVVVPHLVDGVYAIDLGILDEDSDVEESFVATPDEDGWWIEALDPQDHATVIYRWREKFTLG